MERVGGFVELFTQKVPAVCARQKNNPSTASGPPSFARKVKFFLRDSTHLNYLSQNVTFSHLLFGRVSSGRKTFSLIRSTHYSPLIIHLFITICFFTFHFSLFTKSSWFYLFTSLPLDIQKSNYIHLLTCNGFLCYL